MLCCSRRDTHYIAQKPGKNYAHLSRLDFGVSWEALFCVTCYVGAPEILGLLLGTTAVKQQWIVSC